MGPHVKNREDNAAGLTHRGVHPGAGRVDHERQEKYASAGREAQVIAATRGPIDAGVLARLSPGTAIHLCCDGQDIALVNDRGTVFAVDDLCLRCSHALSEGTLAGGRLTCAHCGWEYELESGCVAGLPELKIETHRVRIEDGCVYVQPRPGSAAGLT
jgi:nitrite reductase/ring-hydroxylating ferredoxin subunit